MNSQVLAVLAAVAVTTTVDGSIIVEGGIILQFITTVLENEADRLIRSKNRTQTGCTRSSWRANPSRISTRPRGSMLAFKIL